MDLTLTADQRRIQQAALRVAAEDLKPRALQRDRDGEFPLSSLKTLADAGLMGVNVDARYGGSQAGVIAYSLAVSAIASGDPAVAVTMAVNNMVSEVIQHFGREEQRMEVIPKMTSGAFSSGSFCLSEPGSGSDAAGMRTTAEKTSQGWVINGTKAWITSGAHAGVFLVWAKTGPREISLFLVDPSLEGISIGAAEEKMGQHASNTVALSFDDVEVDESALLGDLGQGFRIAMMALDGGRIGIASQSLGIADAARALIDRFPRRFPSLYARLEAARSITLRAAFLKEEGKSPFSREASMAKLTASEIANQIAASLYASGLSGNDPGALQHLQKLIRDARVTRIYEGTSEIQRVVIARDIINRGLR